MDINSLASLDFKPLRNDPLATELARFAEYNRAVIGEMLVENDAQVRAAQ
jgi:hypothetical protein